jgi:hypothetical protein
MATIQSVRDALESAITSNSVYSVYDHVPETIIPPCVLIVTSDPWLETATLGNTPTYFIRYVLELVAAPISNPGSLINLETMVQTILPLIPNTFQILGVSSPRIRQANTTDVLTAEISVRSIWNP